MAVGTPAPVPLRTRFTLARRQLRAWLVLGVIRLWGLLPFGMACASGRFFGSIAYALDARDRRRALAHLALAFPEKTEAERRRIARDSFRHLGQCAAELAQEYRINDRLDALVDFPDDAKRQFEAALALGKGVIVVTAHIGNWEIAGKRIAREFKGITVIAREMNAPLLTESMDAFRARAGVQTLWRGRPGATKDMLRVFRENRILGLLIDQDTKVQSVMVPFFGRPASTPRAAGDLAVKFEAPLLTAFVHRAPGNRHRIAVRSLETPRTGDAVADGIALTAAATRAIEESIREAPEEWVWMHERWKTQPAA